MTTPDIAAGTWTIDPTHSEVGFTVRHLMVSKVRGNFEKFSGTLTVAEDPLQSSVHVEVDLDSINTREAQRDGHLRSADFFEVEKYPTMTFDSTAMKADGSSYVVTGDLTIKGTTMPVELDLELNGVGPDPWGGTRAGFSAEAEISRKEFGVDIEMPLDGGGVVVGDKIKVLLEIEAVLQSDG
ncbi:MAG: YceI family protein [Acidimicrobiales bacterium]